MGFIPTRLGIINDLQMFDVVDTPIAMGNGHKLAKEKAAYIDNDMDDGIANGLKHFKLMDNKIKRRWQFLVATVISLIGCFLFIGF